MNQKETSNIKVIGLNPIKLEPESSLYNKYKQLELEGLNS